MKCEEYKDKFDRIFQKVGGETASIWKGEKWSNYVDALNYVSCIRGQEVHVKLEFIRDRVKAAVYVGDYHLDYRNYFSKEISFSVLKPELKIVQDLINRLELNSLNDKVVNILEARKKSNENKENEKYRIELFKKFIPFKEGYNGKLYARPKNDVSIEFEPRANILEIRGDTELLMAICANIKQLL
ncbi:hypothetical protein HEMROJRC1_20470 [Rodentibacter sp. JRC1]|uniref:hypothetical protein n=1 Tax=Rodentibacter sp. JRC1 TaxID=2874504 RepID=UPI001CFD6918|nr:hypothetical protein [Rodentibacter sp. JRC1]GJI56935.1 hypothetical protein HEMROJRC1_20470 [Rodentibacter sp. JRC1]